MARLHGLAALALYARNQFGDAAEHADRAVELWDTAGSAPLELGEALLISARMSTLRADPAAARAKALRALGILEAHPPSRALALCYSTLCSQDTMQARFDTALGWCKRALEVAERVGSLDVVSHALGYRGLSKVSLGDDAGLADLERALEVADRLGHGDYVTVAAHNLAVILIRIGRVREARQALEVGERAAREHALDTALFRIEAQQCHVLLIEGSWDEAERRLRRLLRRSEDPGANLVNPLAFLGRILARRGDPEAAGLIERAWRLASATGEDQKMAVAAGARIEHAWIEGDDDRVRAIGGELLELAVRAQHRYLRGEVLRYLRRVGEPVAPFDGCLAPFADGITGDWAAAAAGWERIGKPLPPGAGADRGPRPGGGPARAGHARPAGGGGHGQPGPPAAAPRRGSRHPPGAAGGHQGQPGPADRPPARGAGPAGRGLDQRRDRGPALPLPADRRQPRGRPAGPARGELAPRRPGRRGRPRPAGPAGARNLGSSRPRPEHPMLTPGHTPVLDACPGRRRARVCGTVPPAGAARHCLPPGPGLRWGPQRCGGHSVGGGGTG